MYVYHFYLWPPPPHLSPIIPQCYIILYLRTLRGYFICYIVSTRHFLLCWCCFISLSLLLLLNTELSPRAMRMEEWKEKIVRGWTRFLKNEPIHLWESLQGFMQVLLNRQKIGIFQYFPVTDRLYMRYLEYIQSICITKEQNLWEVMDGHREKMQNSIQ